MIRWLISQQFQEGRFGGSSGVRVVKVAVHPDFANVSLCFWVFFFAGRFASILVRWSAFVILFVLCPSLNGITDELFTFLDGVWIAGA